MSYTYTHTSQHVMFDTFYNSNVAFVHKNRSNIGLFYDFQPIML